MAFRLDAARLLVLQDGSAQPRTPQYAAAAAALALEAGPIVEGPRRRRVSAACGAAPPCSTRNLAAADSPPQPPVYPRTDGPAHPGVRRARREPPGRGSTRRRATARTLAKGPWRWRAPHQAGSGQGRTARGLHACVTTPTYPPSPPPPYPRRIVLPRGSHAPPAHSSLLSPSAAPH